MDTKTVRNKSTSETNSFTSKIIEVLIFGEKKKSFRRLKIKCSIVFLVFIQCVMLEYWRAPRKCVTRQSWWTRSDIYVYESTSQLTPTVLLHLWDRIRAEANLGHLTKPYLNPQFYSHHVHSVQTLLPQATWYCKSLFNFVRLELGDDLPVSCGASCDGGRAHLQLSVLLSLLGSIYGEEKAGRGSSSLWGMLCRSALLPKKQLQIHQNSSLIPHWQSHAINRVCRSKRTANRQEQWGFYNVVVCRWTDYFQQGEPLASCASKKDHY